MARLTPPKKTIAAPAAPRSSTAKSDPKAPARELRVKFGGRYGTEKVSFVSVPAGCKITFAPTNPGDRAGGNGCALRIYQGTDNIALFAGVEEFYDMSLLKIEDLVVTVDETSEEFKDSLGNGGRVSTRSIDTHRKGR